MINEKGCEWHKVEAPAGALIVWDSRTVHYGSVPKSNNPRVATYVCYKPASLITPEYLEKKKEAVEQMLTSVSLLCRSTSIPRMLNPSFLRPMILSCS